MKRIPISLVGPTRAVDGHQELAIAVIRQALWDANNAEQRARSSARAFLADSPMLREWCSVAGLDPSVVLARCPRQES